MTNTPAAGDCRRAMAMIGHHARGYGDGINAIIDEANQANRGTQLFIALLDAYQNIVPELRTEPAIACMSQLVHQIADLDEDPDCRRAASAIIAQSTDDVARFNHVIAEATEQNRTGPLILAILDVYTHLLPELHTPLGLDAISTWTARLSGKENTE